MRPARAWIVTLAAAACAIPAPAAGAATVPVSGMGVVMAFNDDGRHLLAQLGENCTPLAVGYGWGEERSKRPFKHSNLVGAPFLPATGGYDAATGRGAAATKGEAWRFDSFLEHRKAMILSGLGVELAGERAYVTGVIGFGRSRYSAAAARRRLAVVAHARRLEGQAHDSAGESVPNSWIFARQGRAKMLRPLARALEHVRCKHGRFVPSTTRRIKPGTPLGQLTVQLYPDAATGTGGTLDLLDGPELLLDDELPIAIAPAGGAAGSGVAQGDTPGLSFAMVAGAPVPLACDRGFRCAPAAGAAFGLAGGFTLTASGRTATVAALGMSYSTGPTGDVIATLTGTVDGAPLALARSSGGTAGITEELATRLGATLGGTVDGHLGELAATFTSMAPG
jgi:hypothetical protein